MANVYRRWLVLMGLGLALVALGACAAQPATVAPVPSPTPIPTSASLNVVGGKQTKNLTCESQTASDLAKFWGKQVGEIEFFNKLPRSDNPYKGFVGSPDAPPGSLPPSGYGVYAEPVAQTLRSFGLESEAHSKKGINWLRQELAAGRPVMVWATYGFKENPVKTYKTRDGQEVPIVQYEHSFLAVGYDSDGVTVIDPLDGQRKSFPYAEFYRGWSLLDQMAVTARLPVPALSSTSPVTPATARATPPLWIPVVALALLALGLLGLRARPTSRGATRLAHTAEISMARPAPRRSRPPVLRLPPLARLSFVPPSLIGRATSVAASPLMRPLPLAVVGLVVGLGLTLWLNASSTCLTLPILAASAGGGFWLGLWAQALAEGRRRPDEEGRRDIGRPAPTR